MRDGKAGGTDFEYDENEADGDREQTNKTKLSTTMYKN